MNEELIMALSLIKRLCRKTKSCEDCRVQNNDLWMVCSNNFKGNPETWEINNESTLEDEI